MNNEIPPIIENDNPKLPTKKYKAFTHRQNIG